MLLPLAVAFTLLGQPQQAAPDPLSEALRTQSHSFVMVRPSPMIHLSPTQATAYALGNGCVPAVMTGRPATEFFKTAATRRVPERAGLHQISSRVTLIEAANMCTVTAIDGDPADLRTTVLETLDKLTATRVVRSDSGPGSRDSGGDFRQELHCLTLNGEALFLVMSTSSDRNRAPLMASLGRDSDGGCRRSTGS